MEATNSHIEFVPPKKTASIAIQVLLVVNLLIPVYKGFFDIAYSKIVLVGLSITFFFLCVWYLRESFSWTDFIIGIVLVTGLLYYRFVTQKEHGSLLNGTRFLVLGFSLAILFKYAIIPRRTFFIYTILALLPFLYFFLLKGVRLDGTGYLCAINRNSIPLRLIIASSLQVMNDSLQKRKYIIMFPSILTLMCAYFSNSRAGLLMAMILVGVVLITNIWNKWQVWIKENKGKAFIVAALFIFIAIVGGSFIIKDTRLVTIGFKDPARMKIVVEFFEQLTFRNFLFGFHPTLPFDLKSHSSYQTMLTYFGVFAFVIYYAIVVALIHYMKHSFTLFGLLGIWCVYSLVESLGPMSNGDLLLIPLLMVAFYQKGKEFFSNKKKPIQMIRGWLVNRPVKQQ